VNVDLQEDFSIHHALALWLFETIEKLDRADPGYGLEVTTLVESILEDPSLILERQLDRLKTLKLAEMKAAGVEYDERIAELEKMEYPKPNREFVYATFNDFAKRHPWVGSENIRPKSIAREMYESFFSFPEYVKEYGVERAEGLLLRYLSDVYKTLVQTVPAGAKNEAVDDVVTYFGAMVRSVDASLLDEWERMREGKPVTAEERAREPIDAADLTRDAKAFTVLVRNAMFAVVRALAKRDFATVATLFEAGEPWAAKRVEEAMAPFFAEHAAVRVDPAARAPGNTRIEKGEASWKVEQVICDPDDANDWRIASTVDLAASAKAGRPVMRLEIVGAR
jgi:hypothetical protein